jgi:tRNA(Arg) A34 adenosine deaminase TadA
MLSTHLSLPAWIGDLVVPDLAYATDEAKMRVAIELSRRNVEAGTGGPFGAALFGPDDRAISVGVNRVLPERCSVAHAEIMAFIIAQQRLGRPRLNRDADGRKAGPYTLAASSQPCCQCYGATVWAGIDRLLIGARSDDVQTIAGFDEGPLPEDWERHLVVRGIAVARDICRGEAVAILRAYAAAGGAHY